MIFDKNFDRRGSKRFSFETELEIDLDPNSLEATSVDTSDTGIRFDTKEPLKIDIKFTFEGQFQSRKGRLVWAKKKPTGGFTYAFKFLDE